MLKRLTLVLGVVAFVTAAAVGTAHAQDKCKGGKQKAAGKTGGGVFKCDSKADAKALTSTDVATCSVKPDAALTKGYTKADTKGPCGGTAADAQTAINNCEASANTAVGNAGSTRTKSKCDSKKMAGMGKKLSGLMGCDSKESSKGVDQSACRTAVSGKFTTAIGKLSTLTDCSNTSNATTLEAVIDNCRTDLNATYGGGTGTTCAPVVVGQPIPNTYKLQGTSGEKRCVTSSSTNVFGTCNTDADCGGAAMTCLTTPWVTADGTTLPFPTSGISTVFTVATEAPFPGCEHQICVPCGNPNAPCAGIPGCEAGGNPAGCIPRGTQGCCNTPGLIVPTFVVPILGGLCSRVDQIDCGVGVINTSNPQTGDNELTKDGDTSDPGADCCYNGHPGSECIGGVNLNDDPAPKACTTPLTCSSNSASCDYAGKIVRTVGNGSPDTNGIQYRFTSPELSTTWMDSMNPCPQGSKFDGGTEGLVSQLILKAEPTTAGATGAFTEQNGDSCKRAGAGFSPSSPDGPITVGPAPAGIAKPQPYNGSAGSVAVAVSEVFSGPASPIRDIGFVAITPNLPAVVIPAQACTCTVTPSCPE